LCTFLTPFSFLAALTLHNYRRALLERIDPRSERLELLPERTESARNEFPDE